jgi:cellulose synthase/poly-beta-1,6-N-acetylglucosamine synthase-like glycosyltransferase
MSDRSVSFVVPLHGACDDLDTVLEAIMRQGTASSTELELILVDDGCGQEVGERIRAWSRQPQVRVIRGPGRGAAAAINTGIRAASHPIIAQVDQDVILLDGWLERLLDALASAEVAAAQGYYQTERRSGLLARVTGYDLELRYARIGADHVDHVCTGNTTYRRQALVEVGLLDEELGYGYDNDISYRLTAAGYRLAFRRDARSHHRWREGLGAYLRQQYGLGYGRLDLVARHPRRCTGDQVSGMTMILHVPVMSGVVLCLPGAALAATLGSPVQIWLLLASAGLALLGAERLIAAVRAALRFRDPGTLLIAPVHLLRDLTWVCALAVWIGRRLLRRPWRPRDSMPRQG